MGTYEGSLDLWVAMKGIWIYGYLWVVPVWSISADTCMKGTWISGPLVNLWRGKRESCSITDEGKGCSTYGGDLPAEVC
jgi:hypothetical protein